MAPEEPPGIDIHVDGRRWRWIVIGLVVGLAIAGIVMLMWLADEDDDAAGVGPVGPVGPQEPVVVDGGDRVVGSGEVVSEVREVSAFDAVTIAGEGAVVVRQTGAPSVTVRTDDNLLPLITTEVRTSTLFIDKAADVEDIDPSEGVVVEIGVTELAGVAITGAGSITIDGLVTERLVVRLAGAGNFDIAGLEATKLVVDASGVGSVRVAGEVESQEVALAGTVAYDAADLASLEGLVDTESVETAVVWVSDRLDVAVRSLGSVHYYGQAEVTSSTSGAGEVRPLGDR